MTRNVHKFGGSSLSSAARYHAVANILAAKTRAGDAVVVSAAGKTTDTLVKLWQCFEDKDSQGIIDIIQLIRTHQSEIINDLLKSPAEILALLTRELESIEQHIAEQNLAQAWLLAHGELWSARLLAAYLNQIGVAAEAYDSRALFTVTNGELDHARNKVTCAQIDGAKLAVVTGFIAANENGETVTLGRNGSDYSATLLARYIDAEQVSIWTDTQGVFSADPRKVEKAVKYGKICRAQAQLLARLGNPVLHAKTLTPLKDTNINLVVRSSFDSHSEGTYVVEEGSAKQKRFISNLDNYDVIKIDTLNDGEVGELSMLVQHPLHTFTRDGDVLVLVPSQFSSVISEQLGTRMNIVETRVSGVAIVCEKHSESTLLDHALTLLSKENRTVRLAFKGDGYALILAEQQFDSDVLTLLHDAIISQSQELAVIIAGLGNVGGIFVEQLEQQLARLNQLLPVKVVGLLRSKQMQLNCQGIELEDWRDEFTRNSVAFSKEQLLNFVQELDYEHKVVIDITASEQFSSLYPQFVSRDCHLISANKYAGTAANDWYKNLRALLDEKKRIWRYNTSVGAGLPINFSLQDLQNSGDSIERIAGVFSGTLSWLGANFDGTRAFSELVLEAKALGYTEPDPREDLSGRDVQRKLLILIRELGVELNLDDIALSPWMPEALASGSWDDCLTRLNELDSFVNALWQEAQQQGKVLRYVAEVDLTAEKLKASVGLKAVYPDEVVATLKAGDNIFVINSRWYKENALVIQGPGAGKEVTAAGVHSDLYWLCREISK